MNRKTIFTIFAVCVAFALGFTLAARMTNPAGDVIDRDVIASGGNRSLAGSGHVLYSTIGQPVVGISNASNGSMLVHGFHTMTARGETAARRWEMY